MGANQPRKPTVSGDEADLFSMWRHMLNWRPGRKRAIKKLYAKRDIPAELANVKAAP